MVKSSNIGTINISALESAISFAIGSIIGFINPELGQYSIPLPLPDHMHLLNATLISYSRAIEIGGIPEFFFGLLE